jgi:sulfur carrier protein ThiS
MVKMMFRDKEWEVRAGMTVRDAILKLGLDPHAVLAVREGAASSHVRSGLINEATIVEDGETIRLIAVISGG